MKYRVEEIELKSKWPSNINYMQKDIHSFVHLNFTNVSSVIVMSSVLVKSKKQKRIYQMPYFAKDRFI